MESAADIVGIFVVGCSLHASGFHGRIIQGCATARISFLQFPNILVPSMEEGIGKYA